MHTKTSDKTSNNSSDENVTVLKNNSMDNLQTRVQSLTSVALENIGLNRKMEANTWRRPLDGFLSTITFILSSGNVWFFPAVCSYYGGYFVYQFSICFVLISVPLLYMEMALGQFSSASPLSVFSRMVPGLAGVSAGMSFLLVFRVICTSIWTIFDGILLSSSLAASQSKIVWEGCSKTEACLNYRNSFCRWLPMNFSEVCNDYHLSTVATRSHFISNSPFFTYVLHDVLKSSYNGNVWQLPHWPAVVWSIIIWLIVAIISIGGSRVISKTAIVSTILFFLSHIILFIFGLTLDDSLEAVTVLFASNRSYDSKMWLWSWADAASQALRALNVGCGGIQKMSSLNKFHHNFYFDLAFISIISYSSYILHAISSNMFTIEFGRYFYPSEEPGEYVFVYSQPFIMQTMLSEVFSNVTMGTVFVSLYWLSLVLCGMQAMVSYIWIISSMIIERLNAIKRKYGYPLTNWEKRAAIISIMVVVCFISTLPFLGIGGYHLMSSIENYSSYGMLLIALIELFTVSYLYGFKRFCVNINTMLKNCKVGVFWWICWFIVSPLSLVIICLCLFLTIFLDGDDFLANYYSNKFGGRLITSSVLLFVAIYFILEFYKCRKNKEPIKSLFRATGDWGPLSSRDRKESVRQERAARVRY